MELMRRLALISPGDGESLAESLDSIPHGSNSLVIADMAENDGNGTTWRTLLNRTAKFQRMVVVNLEKFGPHSAPMSNSSWSALEFAGVPVITCVPGGLPQALEALGKVDFRYPAMAGRAR